MDVRASIEGQGAQMEQNTWMGLGFRWVGRWEGWVDGVTEQLEDLSKMEWNGTEWGRWPILQTLQSRIIGSFMVQSYAH